MQGEHVCDGPVVAVFVVEAVAVAVSVIVAVPITVVLMFSAAKLGQHRTGFCLDSTDCWGNADRIWPMLTNLSPASTKTEPKATFAPKSSGRC